MPDAGDVMSTIRKNFTAAGDTKSAAEKSKLTQGNANGSDFKTNLAAAKKDKEEPVAVDNRSASKRAMDRIQAKHGLNKAIAEEKASGRKAKHEMDKDSFLKMMMVQMKHQDPTKPMDSSEMAAQLAQFSLVEQGAQLNQTTKSIADRMSFLEAMSLQDKFVEYLQVDDKDSEKFHSIKSRVHSIRPTDNGPIIVLDGDKEIKLSEVKGIISPAVAHTQQATTAEIAYQKMISLLSEKKYDTEKSADSDEELIILGDKKLSLNDVGTRLAEYSSRVKSMETPANGNTKFKLTTGESYTIDDIIKVM